MRVSLCNKLENKSAQGHSGALTKKLPARFAKLRQELIQKRILIERQLFYENVIGIMKGH